MWISSPATASGSRSGQTDQLKTNDDLGQQGRVRTLLDPLKPLVPQVRRLHLLLPEENQPGLPELGRLFPLVVSAPQLAPVIRAFLRFYQVSLHQLDQQRTRSAYTLLRSHWSSSYITALSLVENFLVMLRQPSYAIKNQLKAPKAPY